MDNVKIYDLTFVKKNNSRVPIILQHIIYKNTGKMVKLNKIFQFVEAIDEFLVYAADEVKETKNQHIYPLSKKETDGINKFIKEIIKNSN